VEGALPTHHGNIFSADIKDAYLFCLNRLNGKLARHSENPQTNKINNFIMVLSALYSLIRFIDNETIYEKYKSSAVITPDIWAWMRDYYNMLLMHIDRSWDLTWSKGGYSKPHELMASLPLRSTP
jgi:hypothetical protein